MNQNVECDGISDTIYYSHKGGDYFTFRSQSLTRIASHILGTQVMRTKLGQDISYSML